MAERALTKKNETAQPDTVGNNPRSKLYVKYDYETGPRTTFERIFVSKYRSGDRFPVVIYKQRVMSKRQTIANVLTLIS